jgi:predicted aminopeptidase
VSSKWGSKPALWPIVLVLGIGFTNTGCSSVGYYAQAINGELEILAKRQPIQRLLDDPQTPARLKAQLATILEIRTFASRELALPDNKSYRTYVDLKRPYVVWNVFAAPQLSLQPLHWCFAFVGCVNYRGYFSQAAAEKFADKLRAQSNDVYVAGVTAYSTLGWFRDPVLNTILNRSQAEIAGLIFHELAHQLLFVRNDTTFNESFAMTVEHEGVQRWLAHTGAAGTLQTYLTGQERRDQFVNLIMQTRTRLQQVYASSLADEQKLAAKAQAFSELRKSYEALKQRWGGYSGYDGWFARKLNNAHLVSIGLYNHYVPAFETLLAREHGDLPAFYRAVKELARLPPAQRHARLDALMAPRAVGESPISAARDDENSNIGRCDRAAASGRSGRCSQASLARCRIWRGNLHCTRCPPGAIGNCRGRTVCPA